MALGSTPEGAFTLVSYVASARHACLFLGCELQVASCKFAQTDLETYDVQLNRVRANVSGY